ncbi:MAG: hypothetical protein ABL940_10865 [Bacteroidia bacterium]
MNLKYTLLLLLCINTCVFAQDRIYEGSGGVIKSKIVKITNENIQYRKWKDSNRIVYNIDKKEVLTIIYENGDTVIINTKIIIDTLPNNKTEAGNSKKEYGNEMFSVNALSPVFDHVAIAYEVFSKQGYASIKIPMTFNYVHGAPYIGLELKIFPTAQGVARVFFGPSVIGGAQPVQNLNPYSYLNNKTYTNVRFVAGLIKAGVSLQVTQGFNITIDGGVGNVKFLSSNVKTTSSLVFDAGIHLGYRF